jgi:hypothetical protein
MQPPAVRARPSPKPQTQRPSVAAMPPHQPRPQTLAIRWRTKPDPNTVFRTTSCLVGGVGGITPLDTPPIIPLLYSQRGKGPLVLAGLASLSPLVGPPAAVSPPCESPWPTAAGIEESPASPSPLRTGYVGCIPLNTGHIGMTVGSQKCHTGHEILKARKNMPPQLKSRILALAMSDRNGLSQATSE